MKASKTSSGRRNYDEAFKAKILALHGQGRSVSSLSSSFGINANVIYRWRKNADQKSCDPITKDYLDELLQVRKQLREVEQERDILKKPWAFSAANISWNIRCY